MNDSLKIFIGVSAVTIIIASISIYMFPVRQTNLTLKSLVDKAKVEDWKVMPSPQEDSWGTSIVYNREHSKRVICYEAISAGRDKTMGTEDDLSVFVVDFNKSRIAGEWAGKKSKEVWKGLKDGWNKESKFSVPETEIK